jgi:hypothetical protein
MLKSFEGEAHDEYKNVPHGGNVFEEEGKKYYWTISDVAVGTTEDSIGRAYREDMGGYFGSRTHVRAVDNAVVDGKTITKWEKLEGDGDEMRGDPNPEYGKPGGNLDMPSYEQYRKMYPEK